MTYYAEFGTEKLVREKYFPDTNYKGVMVEVGGGKPEFLSMSKHFKDSGWRAIVIEPNPIFIELHRLVGNEVYPYACSDEDCIKEFEFVKTHAPYEGGMVTFESFSSFKIKQRYLDICGFERSNMDIKTEKVQARRLDSILEELHIDSVDFISIDVEGWELEVLKGIDTEKIKCNLFVVENFTNDQSYRDYFKSLGYKLDDKIKYNEFYTK